MNTDFKVAIHESDLSEDNKEYLLTVTEAMVSGLAMLGVFYAGAIGTFAIGVSAEILIRNHRLAKCIQIYEKNVPDLDKWNSLKKSEKGISPFDVPQETPSEEDFKTSTYTVDVQNVHPSSKIIAAKTKKGEDLFEIHIQENNDTPSKPNIYYTSKSPKGHKHSGYYIACLCLKKKIWLPSLKKWCDAVHKAEKENVLNESTDIFSDDFRIKAGLTAAGLGQYGASVCSGQERQLRREIQNIQSTLTHNQFGMSSTQQAILVNRMSILMDQLGTIERRKGTSTAVRNAALIIAASALLKKKYMERDKGPDSEEFLNLIGGIPDGI